ncbi:hypothetical protein, partial [Pseudomonas sp. OA65]|uniref:hypothetical protein n=1 Tax=Pseudomonas sp. OA65 TaxID=2818431 RepID=UPI001A9D439C
KAVIVSLESYSVRLQSWVFDWSRLKKLWRTRGWILFDESLLPVGGEAVPKNRAAARPSGSKLPRHKPP